MIEDGFLELMKEEHLDILIRLAFELNSAQIIEQLEKEAEQTFSDKDEQVTQQAMKSAYEKLRLQELHARKNLRADRRHHRLMRAIEIVACIVLVISISAPVAVANIETLRLKIMEFLVSFDVKNESADIKYSEEVNIPAGWAGKYFPTYLPEGAQPEEIDPLVNTKIVFALEDDKTIVFSENTDGVYVAMGVENESSSTVNINGYEAQLWEFFDEEHFIRIVWDIGERWFMLETKNLDFRDAYSIAESVKIIID